MKKMIFCLLSVMLLITSCRILPESEGYFEEYPAVLLERTVNNAGAGPQHHYFNYVFGPNQAVHLGLKDRKIKELEGGYREIITFGFQEPQPVEHSGPSNPITHQATVTYFDNYLVDSVRTHGVFVRLGKDETGPSFYVGPLEKPIIGKGLKKKSYYELNEKQLTDFNEYFKTLMK